MERNANKGLKFVMVSVVIILILIAITGLSMWWADYRVHK